MYYTACVDCKELLSVSYVGQEAHPSCRPSEVYQLTSQWCEAAQRDDAKECKGLQKRIDELDHPPEFGPSALWYATECHWPVFPLVPNTKRPATKNGLKDATTDPDQIRAWWSDSPFNIGLITGHAFDVIDIDGPIGFQSLSELGADALPDIHGRVNSPRGQHLYVKSTGDGNRVGVRPGVDYRGKSGYVCAPCSVIDDRRWAWAMQPSPEIMEKA